MGNVEVSCSLFQPRFSGSLAARRDELRCSLFQAHTQWGRRESKRHAKFVFTFSQSNRLVTMNLPQWSAVYFFSNHT